MGGVLRGLRYVVLDEVHTYRGVFGSHVANVLRRLKRVCRFHGSNPQFILSSATVANPAEHAASLLAGPVAAVTESGAPRGKATFYVYNPPLVDGAKGIRGSYIQAARRLTRALAKAEVPTIVFANSRLNVERLTRHLQEDVASEGIDPTTVSGYRGGYLPDHRRAVEAGLRGGPHPHGGVDERPGAGGGRRAARGLRAGGLPGHHREPLAAGRAGGRRDSPAVIILVARSEAVDQYLAAHPDALFGQTPEHALLDPDHLLIVADHLKCAAFELPFKAGEAFGTFGADRTAEVLGWLAGRRLLLEGAERWQWTGEPYPAQGVGLRAIAEGNFTVLDKAHKHRVVGEVDYHAAASTLYPQAIYIVGGETYQVLDLDWTGRRATVEPVAVDYYTDAVTFEGLARLSVFDDRRVAGEGAGVGHGEVRVFERVVGFKKIRFATGENVGYGDVQLPETELHTTGLWLEAPEDLGLRLGLALHQTIDALEGLLRAIRHVAAVRLMCSPGDLGTAAVGEGPAEGLPTLYVYERYPGGVGLHEALFEQAEAVLADADALLGGCGCTDGCPACVGAAAMGEVRSRRRVRDVLRVLRGERGQPAVVISASCGSA
ncbi:MAG: Zn-binding domain-containing protein [bacterium]